MVFAQSNDFTVEFDHEWNYKKFFNKHVSGKGTRKFAERSPYVHSGTLDLSIDHEGKILAIDFIEKNDKEDMNNFFKQLAMDTDGLWKPINVPNGSDNVHVIIPFVYRTAPFKKKDDRPDLIEKFNEYHNNLDATISVRYTLGNYFLIPEVVIYSGPLTRGVK